MILKKTLGILLASSVLLGGIISSQLGALPAFADTVKSQSNQKNVDENSELERLYKNALAEGGKLVIYAGGDAPNQQAGVKDAFEKRFPGMTVDIKVDLSKYHDVRIDNQLLRGSLQADIAHLQTLQDFSRWKEEGHLLKYQPVGWDKVYPAFKDKDGYFTALNIITFSNIVNNVIPDNEAPRDALDYLDPKYKGKLVLTYPNDDDAVLYQFKVIIDKYGWEYMDKLMAQKPQFIRGSAPAKGIVESGEKVATFTASGTLVPATNSNTRMVLPKNDSFLTWPQTAAIFKDAKHPAAAKLYMNWRLSKEYQDSLTGWPVRKDAVIAGGYKPVFEYNTDPTSFRTFMHDRAALERFRGQIALYVGDPQGPSPTADTLANTSK